MSFGHWASGKVGSNANAAIVVLSFLLGTHQCALDAMRRLTLDLDGDGATDVWGGMTDVSWDRSAARYADLYRTLTAA